MSASLGAGGAVNLPPLAIFTDFDGTLVELAPTPDSIVVPAGLGEEIARVADRLGGAVAVISGRAIDDLDRYLPSSLAAAGSHGAERRRADGSRVVGRPEREADARTVADRLEAFVREQTGLLVEPKPGSVALHYRLAPHCRELCLAAMDEALRDVEGFEALEGKMVVEARPAGTSKGEAIRAFMQEVPFKGRVPVFFGDDLTDEEGFAAARELGGVGVKVGAGETAAQLRAEDIRTARSIIRRLASGAPLREVDAP